MVWGSVRRNASNVRLLSALMSRRSSTVWYLVDLTKNAWASPRRHLIHECGQERGAPHRVDVQVGLHLLDAAPSGSDER